jgi:hypothetical protein
MFDEKPESKNLMTLSLKVKLATFIPLSEVGNFTSKSIAGEALSDDFLYS